MENYMLCAKDVEEMLGIKSALDYKLIRQMNDELAKAGYIVVAGKVPKAYWDTKFYGSNVSETK